MIAKNHQASRPDPDPTVLTTQQVTREIGTLKELLFTRFEGMENATHTRFDGMDKAIELLQEISDNFPNIVDEKIASLHAVHEEKFSSIQKQFDERDVRSEQSSKDNKVAVDAALQAAKEAVGEQNKSSAISISKSEAAIAKQIDGIDQRLKDNNKSFDDKYNDVKERLLRIEGKGEAKTEHTAQSNWVIGIGIGIALAVVQIVLHFIPTPSK